MRIPLTVKTAFPSTVLLLAALSALAQDIDPLKADAKAGTAATDPKTAAAVKSLRSPDSARLHPAADALSAATAHIRISLRNHRMEVFAGEELAVECPIAHGRPASPTAEGEFTISAKIAEPKGLNYGHIREANGTIRVRGVFGKYEPLPAHTVFDLATPKCAFKLQGEGPLIFAGEATGAATSDGSIVIPDKIALFLFEKLEVGVRVTIES